MAKLKTFSRKSCKEVMSNEVLADVVQAIATLEEDEDFDEVLDEVQCLLDSIRESDWNALSGDAQECLARVVGSASEALYRFSQAIETASKVMQKAR